MDRSTSSPSRDDSLTVQSDSQCNVQRSGVGSSALRSGKVGETSLSVSFPELYDLITATVCSGREAQIFQILPAAPPQQPVGLRCFVLRGFR